MTSLLDHVTDQASGDRVFLDDILQTLGTRSYGPALLFVALVSMLPPISVTPGLPMITGSLIVVLSLQLLILRPNPWLPKRILQVSWTREKLGKTLERARPWARRVDKFVGPRLSFLVQPPIVNAIAFICVLLGFLTFPLSVLPAGENIPAAAVLFFALALTTRDGLLAVIGLLVTGAAIGATIWFWPAITRAFADLIPQIAHSANNFLHYMTNRIAILTNVFWAMGAVLFVLVVGSIVRITVLGFKRSEEKAQKRLGSLITWWVLFGLLALIVLLGKLAAVVLFAIATILGLREYRALVAHRVADRHVWWLAFLAVPVHYLIVYFGWLGPFWTFIPVSVFVILLIRLVVIGETGRFLETAGITFMGLMLIVFLFSHAVLFFALPDDVSPGATGLLVYLLLLTECNDIAQALWGRQLGKRKIVPRVSPGKTWEGFLLGATTTLILAQLMAPLLTPFAHGDIRIGQLALNAPYFPALAAGILISVGGFFGDITMSAIKREVGVKDSGTTLPGQGGLLDRIDSLTFTAPVFFYFTYFFYG